MRERKLFLIFIVIVAAFAAFLGRSSSAQSTAPPQRTVVITVDDLPGAIVGNDFAMGDLKELQKINRAIPAILKSHHAWAIGFVNERKLQQNHLLAKLYLCLSRKDLGNLLEWITSVHYQCPRMETT